MGTSTLGSAPTTTTYDGPILVIGNVSAKAYQPVRIDVMQDGCKPEIHRRRDVNVLTECLFLYLTTDGGELQEEGLYDWVCENIPDPGDFHSVIVDEPFFQSTAYSNLIKLFDDEIRNVRVYVVRTTGQTEWVCGRRL